MESFLQKTKEIAPMFDIPLPVLEVNAFGNGHINDTFLIKTPEQSYVLQRISPQAFPHPEQIMENMQHVTQHLRQAVTLRGGDPARETLCMIPMRDGKSYMQDAEGHVWRMTLCIPGCISLDLPDRPEVFRESGRAFGMFARDLDGFPAETLYETIPHFHDTPRRYEAFEKVLREDPCKRASTCQDLITCFQKRKHQASTLMDQLTAGHLPLRVTHNDTKLNNVMLDDTTQKAVCVVDLDTVMPGLIAYDFGDAIRFGANTAAEDEKDRSKIHFSLPMYSAFTEGYLSEAGSMLTQAELESLPIGAWMMTYECGMRFLTDYLQGDTYFHTAYPDHNLVRAWDQMTLLKDMEQYQEQMRAIVKDFAQKGSLHD